LDEYLGGADFAREVESFFNRTIDKVAALPVAEVFGHLVSDKLQFVKDQVTTRILALARSAELATSVSAYATDALTHLQSQRWKDLLETAGPDSPAKLKNLLTKNLLAVLERDETAREVNAVISNQIEKLLVAPIGKLSDYLPEDRAREAAEALTERIVATSRERLPAAIAEFDVGGIVRNKVENYPLPKLEELVLSVAKQHLRTIEIFGAVIGLVIGIFQALYFWIFSK
jgi:uncharacterized membrane protein YheB (UPF0754 family)